ncbi:GyrI-like domain-containing protein [Paenibacillus sp. GCM10027627]|uniref:GyrI-like domain-containing protein n=1 Tax=unclassified Paenibacillus TaxID=185978 RepID=UPI00362ACD2E
MKQNDKPIEPARFETLPAFTLAGISVVTTNTDELSGSGKIGGLFGQFYSRQIEGQLADRIEKPGVFSCYFDYENGDAGLYEVMVSVQVKQEPQTVASEYPESVKTFTVPSATYAVFVTEQGPIIEMVQQAWAGIWQWSRRPGNERAFTGDFEFYAPHIDPSNGQVEIYIAVRN